MERGSWIVEFLDTGTGTGNARILKREQRTGNRGTGNFVQWDWDDCSCSMFQCFKWGLKISLDTFEQCSEDRWTSDDDGIGG